MEQTVEREISLRNLFWKLLSGWRRWLALGVIFAILVSGMKYAKDTSAYQAAVRQQNSAGNAEGTAALTQEERISVEDARALQNQISRLQKYMQESVLMNLDAYNENVLTVQYYVDSDYTFNYTEENETDYSDAVAVAYCDYAESGALADVVWNALDPEIQESYINELITTVSNMDTFQIFIVYNDAEGLEQLKAAVKEAIAGQTAQLSREIGSHSLKLLSEDITVKTDTDLAARQKSQRDMLTSYRSQLTTLKGTMTTAQLDALGVELVEEGEEDTEVQEVVPVHPSFSVKYMILGFIVGIFLACVWIVLEVLFSSRIQETEEITMLYGVRSLGELTVEEQKKKIFGMIDAFILKLKKRNQKQMTREQQMRIICSNLEIGCKKEGLDKIYLTGSEIEKVDQSWLSDLKTAMSSVGITVCSGENVVYDARSLKEMAKIGHVVLVEQAGVSLYKEVEKEIKMAKDNGVEIMGSIMAG